MKAFWIIAIGVTLTISLCSIIYFHLPYLMAFLLGINLSALIFMAFDKSLARKQQFRVPEKLIFVWALIGGSVGIFLGSQIFKHKTRKPSFNFVLLLIFAIQVFLLKQSGFTLR